MKKGFSLAEFLVVLTVAGIIISLTIPTITNSMGNTNKLLYKTANKIVSEVVNELVNDSSLYPAGILDNTLCNNFSAKINTIGTVTCSSAAVIPTSPNFTTTNGMRWYGFSNTFASCSGASFTGLGLSGNCMQINVDTDGSGKGKQLPGSDILRIMVDENGKVVAPTGTETDYLSN